MDMLARSGAKLPIGVRLSFPCAPFHSAHSKISIFSLSPLMCSMVGFVLEVVPLDACWKVIFYVQ